MGINKSSLLTRGLVLFQLSCIHIQHLKEIGISSKNCLEDMTYEKSQAINLGRCPHFIPLSIAACNNPSCI